MNYALLVVAVIGISAVQLLVKYRFNIEHGKVPGDGSIISYLFDLLADPWLWVAGLTLVISALLWYFSLSRLSLSVAIAFAAFVYPLVMIGSVLFLGESIGLSQSIGCLLIVSGIWLIA